MRYKSMGNHKYKLGNHQYMMGRPAGRPHFSKTNDAPYPTARPAGLRPCLFEKCGRPAGRPIRLGSKNVLKIVDVAPISNIVFVLDSG